MTTQFGVENKWLRMGFDDKQNQATLDSLAKDRWAVTGITPAIDPSPINGTQRLQVGYIVILTRIK